MFADSSALSTSIPNPAAVNASYTNFLLVPKEEGFLSTADLSAEDTAILAHHGDSIGDRVKRTTHE